MTPDALMAAVRKDVEGKPFRPLYSPESLDEGTVYLKIFHRMDVGILSAFFFLRNCSKMFFGCVVSPEFIRIDDEENRILIILSPSFL
jgi:hypothetical protein